MKLYNRFKIIFIIFLITITNVYSSPTMSKDGDLIKLKVNKGSVEYVMSLSEDLESLNLVSVNVAGKSLLPQQIRGFSVNHKKIFVDGKVAINLKIYKDDNLEYSSNIIPLEKFLNDLVIEKKVYNDRINLTAKVKSKINSYYFNLDLDIEETNYSNIETTNENVGQYGGGINLDAKLDEETDKFDWKNRITLKSVKKGEEVKDKKNYNISTYLDKEGLKLKISNYMYSEISEITLYGTKWKRKAENGKLYLALKYTNIYDNEEKEIVFNNNENIHLERMDNVIDGYIRYKEKINSNDITIGKISVKEARKKLFINESVKFNYEEGIIKFEDFDKYNNLTKTKKEVKMDNIYGKEGSIVNGLFYYDENIINVDKLAEKQIEYVTEDPDTYGIMITTNVIENLQVGTQEESKEDSIIKITIGDKNIVKVISSDTKKQNYFGSAKLDDFYEYNESEDADYFKLDVNLSLIGGANQKFVFFLNKEQAFIASDNNTVTANLQNINEEKLLSLKNTIQKFINGIMPMLIFFSVIAVGLQLIILKKAPIERAKSITNILYISIGVLIFSSAFLTTGLIEKMADSLETGISEDFSVELNDDEYESYFGVTKKEKSLREIQIEKRRDVLGFKSKNDNMLDSFLTGVIKVGQYLKKVAFGSDVTLNRVLFLIPEEGSMISPVEPFGIAEWNRVMNFYFIAMALSLPYIIVMVLKTGVNYIYKSHSPKEVAKLKEDFLKWFIVIGGIFIFPLVFVFILKIFNELTQALPTNGLRVDYIDAIKTESGLTNIFIDFMYVALELKIFLLFLVRKIILTTMFLISPLVLIIWSIDSEVDLTNIWFGEIISNASTQFIYSTVFFIVLYIINGANLSSGFRILWFYMAIIIASKFKGAVQTYRHDKHGFDEEGAADEVFGNIQKATSIFSQTVSTTKTALVGGMKKMGNVVENNDTSEKGFINDNKVIIQNKGKKIQEKLMGESKTSNLNMMLNKVERDLKINERNNLMEKLNKNYGKAFPGSKINRVLPTKQQLKRPGNDAIKEISKFGLVGLENNVTKDEIKASKINSIEGINKNLKTVGGDLKEVGEETKELAKKIKDKMPISKEKPSSEIYRKREYQGEAKDVRLNLGLKNNSLSFESSELNNKELSEKDKKVLNVLGKSIQGTNIENLSDKELSKIASGFAKNKGVDISSVTINKSEERKEIEKDLVNPLRKKIGSFDKEEILKNKKLNLKSVKDYKNKKTHNRLETDNKESDLMKGIIDNYNNAFIKLRTNKSKYTQEQLDGATKQVLKEQGIDLDIEHLETEEFKSKKNRDAFLKSANKQKEKNIRSNKNTRDEFGDK